MIKNSTKNHPLIESLQQEINAFSSNVRFHKEHSVHINNQFNLQFGVLLRDFNYIKTLAGRIDKGDHVNLDLKTLYVFGRVYVETLIYLSSLFVPTNTKVDWGKLGRFIETVKAGLEKETSEMCDFWDMCGEQIEATHEVFKYRNSILHDKPSTTEWTMNMNDPSRSNLENISISNMPWSHDKKTKKRRSVNAVSLLGSLLDVTRGITSHIKSSLDK